MRRALFLGFCLFLALAPRGSWGQVALRAGTGAIVPMSPGEVTDAVHTGMGAEVGFQIPWTSWLSIVPTVSYDRFHVDDEWAREGEAMAVWTGAVHLQIDLPGPRSRIEPYAFAGGSVHHLKNVPREVQVWCAAVAAPCPPLTGVRDPGFRPGLRLGVGLSIQVDRWIRLFVEPTYTRVFRTVEEWYTSDRNVAYVPLNAGILVEW